MEDENVTCHKIKTYQIHSHDKIDPLVLKSYNQGQHHDMQMIKLCNHLIIAFFIQGWVISIV